MCKLVYGYCRISTSKQNIERQVRNITAAYPDAIIRKETFTGTKFQGRKELDKILKKVHKGDTIVFDSVSRMSRNAQEGFELYQELFEKGIELVFLREPHINTATYKSALSSQIPLTGGDVDLILKGINQYLLRLAEKQIIIAFEQSEKEVQDLHKRTAEGIETARRAGKQIGGVRGRTLTTKKSIEMKAAMRKLCKDFGGNMNDIEAMKTLGIARNTFYKYKREISEELAAELNA